jgi:hypothetical protein
MYILHRLDIWPVFHRRLDIFLIKKFIYKLFQYVFVFKRILNKNKKIYTYIKSNKLRTIHINKWKKT